MNGVNYSDGPSGSSKFVKIGNVKAVVQEARNPEKVPVGFVNIDSATPREVETIKWMLQKNTLKQDIFLIGAPGFLRSQIVFEFLELCNREFEYLSITRDTTEADIKQRREILGGSVFYSDLCAVNAAINGRVLVIDGIEKAERNVLPILNNLLENREMQLDDGRFLMAANKFDKLLEKHSEDQLKQWKLERVSQDFQVVALGLPVPGFHGHTLDPPLRSRFQSRNVTHLPFNTMFNLATSFALNVNAQKLNNLLELIYGFNSQNSKFGGVEINQMDEHLGRVDMPLFPLDNVLKAVRIWNNNPAYTPKDIFSLCYPERTLLKTDTQLPLLKSYLDKFSSETNRSLKSKPQITSLKMDESGAFSVVETSTSPQPFNVPIGERKHDTEATEFVSTPGLETLLSELILAHSAGDFCLLGHKGSGKSAVIKEFARRMRYDVETLILYQDMNSRELFQQRRILPNGDTIWEDSPLVCAAKEGKLCVLDGLERVHSSMVEALAPLIHHRFLQLPDGSRFVSAMQYELLKRKNGLSDEELQQRKVFKISPNFRLIAIADSESANSSTRWLREQLLSLFLFHTLEPMSVKEKLAVISSLVPNMCPSTAKSLLQFVDGLQNSADAAVRGISYSLSLRRCIFILKRHALNPDEGIYEAVHRAALVRFLPAIIRDAFEAKLKKSGIVPTNAGWLALKDGSANSKSDGSWAERLLKNGQTNDSRSMYDETMVPDILFYENPQHQRVMSSMASDFELGSHLLLIGNQGVGWVILSNSSQKMRSQLNEPNVSSKNKIVDRFLQLINRLRQYMQLHRDSTVQSLTVQTTIVDGVLKHEDSPLVKAVKHGLVLVIDEADKAPLHVVAILKSLLDTGVLYLADGRKIVPSGEDLHDSSNNIVMHKDFRMIMLANRPGFPFLGNDLFGLLGDLFSVHIVDNPDKDSEIVMLKQYAPDVPQQTLETLVSIFSDLREMADQSLLSYPYSTRELVNIAKHLQQYPSDNIADVIGNVFDFDAYSKDTIETIQEVFDRHGINLGISWHKRASGEVKLGADGLPERIELEKNEFDLSKLDDPKLGKVDPNNDPHVGGNTWAGGTGGYNTAGLGGIGGPFRLDAGHNVHQLPDSAKQQVPEHILKKAREVNRMEYAKKLKEIDMSEYDAGAYNDLHARIGKQVKIFKSILDSLEAREHERQWAKHQTSGDLDDGKLIEGMTGEKAIYRRRISQPPDPSAPQTKPKRVRLCFDVSGSMYRFNGYDQRLQKSMESALLVMEAMENNSDKIKYDIVGHSGDGPLIPFVSTEKQPKNEKEKLTVLKKMLAHTQYCMSGDSTLEAIELAVNDLKNETNVDERFVIALSDANLDRYGIRPQHLAAALNTDESVNAFLILIGSLGQQAHSIQRALPAGKAFVANNSAEIPQIMQKIFASTIMK